MRSRAKAAGPDPHVVRHAPKACRYLVSVSDESINRAFRALQSLIYDFETEGEPFRVGSVLPGAR